MDPNGQNAGRILIRESWRGKFKICIGLSAGSRQHRFGYSWQVDTPVARDMKLNYSMLAVLLISLPLLWVTLAWDSLPAQLPLHFNRDRQPDKFGNKQEWLVTLLSALILQSIIRKLVLRTVGNQQNIQPTQRPILELLTAGFIGVALLLLILQGLYRSPVYSDWIPALFFLSGSAFIYLSVPPELPTQVKDPATLNAQAAKRLATLQHMHQLSRLVVFRVNVVAVLLMVFANHSDRWSIGILANVLAYVFLFILTITLNRPSV